MCCSSIAASHAALAPTRRCTHSPDHAGATVVDVGAHVGLFGARCLTRVAGGDVRYVGVEPCPPTLAAARANLLGSQHQWEPTCWRSFFHLNDACSHVVAPAAPGRHVPPWPGARACWHAPACMDVCMLVLQTRPWPAPHPPPHADNITLLGKAVCDAPGRCLLTFFPRTPANATLHPERQAALLRGLLRPGMLEGAVQFDVPCVTLGQVLAEAGVTGDVHLLKVDAEVRCCTCAAACCCACRLPGVSERKHEHECMRPVLPCPCHVSRAPSCRCCAASVMQSGGGCGRWWQRCTMCSTVRGGGTVGADTPCLGFVAAPATCINLVLLPAAMLADVEQQPAVAPAVIDGDAVVFDAGASGSSPPPCAGGRVLHVAGLLVLHDFRLVIDCPLGVPSNYMLFARRVPVT